VCFVYQRKPNHEITRTQGEKQADVSCVSVVMERVPVANEKAAGSASSGLFTNGSPQLKLLPKLFLPPMAEMLAVSKTDYC
jgi:hypothetical protein